MAPGSVSDRAVPADVEADGQAAQLSPSRNVCVIRTALIPSDAPS